MRNGRPSTMLALAGIVATAVLALTMVSEASQTPCDELDLQAADWLPPKARTGSPSKRQQIAKDVLRCRALEGETKAEVVRQIGHPSGSNAADTWQWVIGKEAFIGFPEVMSVEFDDVGRVRRVFTSHQ